MRPPRGRAQLRTAARAVLRAALAAADPEALVRRALRRRGRFLEAAGMRHRLGRGRIVLVAAGKAAPAMARAACDVLGPWLDEGIAVSTATAAAPPARVTLLTASHPVPDRRGQAAAERVLALARGLAADDLLLVLLSGGASALLPAPVDGVSLQDERRTTALLLGSGATIQETNAVRKHLSRLRGGGLARAARRARIATLALSDVVGDDPSTIASGPTVADPTTFGDALAALRRRGILGRVPRAVRTHLEAGARGARPETPKLRDPAFRRSAFAIVGSNRLSVAAAAREARRRGLAPAVLTTRLEGEAREAARVLVAILRERVAESPSGERPLCLLVGGETTVSVRGHGRGGRNQELALAAAEALARFPSAAVVATLATDGIDGASDAAGAIADDRTAARAAALGLAPPAAFLAENDSYAFFGPLGDLVTTGPTGTNVMDVTVLLAGPSSSGASIIP